MNTIQETPEHFTYRMGDKLQKKKGSEWSGRVVGWYSTEQTPEGYCIESEFHKNTVQLYPLQALEPVETVPALDPEFNE